MKKQTILELCLINSFFYANIRQMGFFSWIIGEKWTDIKIDDEKASELVYPHKLKSGKLVLGGQLFVPNNCSFVFGKSGKTYDFFHSGTYQLSAMGLPLCSRKFKLHKITENGKPISSFKIDAYFINLQEHSADFASSLGVVLLDEHSFRHDFKCQGKATFKVVDSRLFLNALLYEYGRIKRKEAELIVGRWALNIVYSKARKYSFENIIEKPNEVQKIIHQEISQEFANSGLDLISIKLELILDNEKVECSQPTASPTQKLQIEGLKDFVWSLGDSPQFENTSTTKLFGESESDSVIENIVKNQEGSVFADWGIPAETQENKSQNYVDLSFEKIYSGQRKFCKNCGCELTKGRTCGLCGQTNHEEE